MADGTNIQLWESNNSCAQRWKIVKVSEDIVNIMSSCSSKALDVSGANMKSGTNIDLWTMNDTNAQKWKLMPAEEVKEGLYYINSMLNTSKVIDINGGSHKASNGTNIQLWSGNYSAAQRWYIQRDKNGYYTITNKQSGRVLDVKEAGANNGANVQIWKGNSTCAQKWKILKNGNQYTFISACSNKVLDVESASKKDGANIQIYAANNSKAQKWELKGVSIVKDGEYVISSSVGKNKVVDIAGNSDKDGANIRIKSVNGSKVQKWKVIYDKKVDYYRVESVLANKSLDVDGAGMINGTNVQTWGNNSTCAQKWTISESSGGYVFYSACSGLALDVEGGKNMDGTNIDVYQYNNTNAQKWA